MNVPKQFSALTRTQLIKDMQNQHYDLIVIGGGITGAGIAFDAASRGMKTALVEMQDFSAGTSSRSTKLIHGGLRYLKQLEIKMVAMVAKERTIVYENGPHITKPEWMILPIYEEGSLNKLTTSIGLRLYDFLADVKKDERHYFLNPDAVIKKLPYLKKEGLIGAGCYVEYRSDDARLTIDVVKEAVRFGADAINYVKANRLLYEGEKLNGIEVHDEIGGDTFRLRGRQIVNATGPWGEQLFHQDTSVEKKHLFHSKGVHLVFDQTDLPLTHPIYFDTNDGRMMFAIPRDGKTYVGTTDTKYNGSLLYPTVTIKDENYIVQNLNELFPSLNLSIDMIESSWAGIRPLIHEEGKHPSEISRKDEVWHSASGLITIAGGKLTGYRKMAELIVDLVAGKFKKQKYKLFDKCRTKKLAISGGHVGGSIGFEKFAEKKTVQGIQAGITESKARALIERYGSNVDEVFRNLNGHFDELPRCIFAELKYSVENEMVVKPADFLIRRTGAVYFDRLSVQQFYPFIVSAMSELLRWDKATHDKYKREFEEEVRLATEGKISLQK
jgi:glycerol-3-phosphate dehydrogenase